MYLYVFVCTGLCCVSIVIINWSLSVCMLMVFGNTCCILISSSVIITFDFDFVFEMDGTIYKSFKTIKQYER